MRVYVSIPLFCGVQGSATGAGCITLIPSISKRILKFSTTLPPSPLPPPHLLAEGICSRSFEVSRTKFPRILPGAPRRADRLTVQDPSGFFHVRLHLLLFPVTDRK